MGYSQHDILYNWENSAEIFREWLLHVCGIHIDSETYQFLYATVRTKEEIKLFIDCFDGDICNLDGTVRRFMLRNTG